jgi:hypothetical protein
MRAFQSQCKIWLACDLQVAGQLLAEKAIADKFQVVDFEDSELRCAALPPSPQVPELSVSAPPP